MGAKNTQVSKICTVCSKTFSVVKCREHTAVVCSRECKGVITAAKYKAERIKRNCLICGKSMEILPSRAAIGGGKYCSYSCHNLAMFRQEHKKWADGNENHHSDGYVLVRASKHPFAVNGTVFKHRIAMEEYMRNLVPHHKFLVEIEGIKYLRREIHVHHIDENKEHNEVSNLIACTAAAHRDIHDKRPVLDGEIYPDHEWIQKREYRGVKCECQTCNKEFFLPPSAVADGRGKFCSNECKHRAYAIDAVCKCCKKQFTLTRSLFLNGNGQFCSDLCRAIQQ